jgi:hypothetical protein
VNWALRIIVRDDCDQGGETYARYQSVGLRSAGRAGVLDSQRRGPLDNRVPVFGVRRDRSYGSLTRDDNPIFSHIFVAIAVTGNPAIAGGLCCARNMDYRSLHVDIQFEFLWRRAFAARRVAVLCFRHTIVSAVYASDVRLRRYILRSAPNDIAASHPRELPLQTSRTPVTVVDPLRSPNSAVLSRMVAFSDCGIPFRESVYRDLFGLGAGRACP